MAGQMLTTQPSMKSKSIIISLLILTSGFAALSWEVLWQLKSALALGVSAWGTAITLRGHDGRHESGQLYHGQSFAQRAACARDAFVWDARTCYWLRWIIIECSFSKPGTVRHMGIRFNAIIYFTCLYSGITVILGVPALCMGATLPAFSIFAKQFRTSIAKLYSLNTLGAAVGALAVAVILIPLFGITHSTWIIAAVNILAGIFALVLARR